MATSERTTEPVGLPVNSYDTALCLIPPEHLWPSIDRLRMLYDDAYEKWPPHVNLVYPFVGLNSLSSASKLILAGLRDWGHERTESTWRVQLDEAGVFPHRHDNTIYICDKDTGRASGLTELRERILGALGQKPGTHQMHMTIGQSEDLNSSPHKFLLEKAGLLPAIKWDVNQLHILVRERTQIDGHATSRVKLWGVIDLTTLSISRMDEPTAVHEGEASTLGVDAEHDAIADTSSPSRLPYVYSPSDQKWKICSPLSLKKPLPQSLTVASYNVLAEFHYPPSRHRYPIIIRNLLDGSAASDVLVLQEVTDDFLSYVLRDDEIRERYQFVSCGPPEQPDIEPLPSHLNTVVLSKWLFSWDWVNFRRRHKGSVILRFDNIGKHSESGFLPAVLATVHLTCGLTDGSVANKKLELQSVLKYLSKTYPQNPWIVAGDFNITTSAYTIDTALKKKAISAQTVSYLSAMETMLTEAGLVDAWSYARVQYGDSTFDQDQRYLSAAFEGEEGATFDPTVNELAAEIIGGGFNNRPQRYDRILVRGEHLFTVSGFNMFGKSEGLLGNRASINRDGGDDAQEKMSYGSDHWGVRCSLKTASHTSERTIDDNRKLVVPVELKPASGDLGDVTQLRECLAERNVFPSVSDINSREAAFALLKEVIVEDDGSGNVRGKPKFVLVPVGSYGLGVWTASSDIDCLCIGPISTRTFFTLAAQRLRKAAGRGVKVLRRVNAHSGTMLELEIHGIRMDLQYCPSTFIAETWPHAMSLPPADPVFSLPAQTLNKLKPVRDMYYVHRTIPDFAAFKTAYHLVRYWAKQRGIYAARFGYLGGIHIAILLARVCKLLSCGGRRIPVPALLATFFDHYARFDWQNHMAFDPFFHSRKLRYTRTPREPMAILGFHPPSLNVATAASAPSVRTISEELKRASALLSRDGMTWPRFLGGGGEGSESGAAEFLRAYKTYVRIDAQFWGVSLAKGSSFVGWLESRCVMLLVDLNRRLPNIHARIWPARFVDGEPTEEDKDYQGSYLIGLNRPESSSDQSAAKEGMQITIGTLQTVLEKFEGQIRGDEKYFDSKSCWMSASLAKQSEVSHLRLDGREWGEYTIGDDEEDEEEEEDEAPEYVLDSDMEAAAAKTKRSVPPALPSRPAYSGKFRSSADVISRLRWDPEMDSGDYVVGYEDRFLGIRERALDQWKSEQTDEEFIPQHRIEYFKRKNDRAVVWDRRQRRDDIFGSGVSSLPQRDSS